MAIEMDAYLDLGTRELGEGQIFSWECVTTRGPSYFYCSNIYVTYVLPFLSIQFSGVKYIHLPALELFCHPKLKLHPH